MSLRVFAQRRSVSIALRLLLILSLWDGPILWGHQHSAGCSHLPEHLAKYHANDARAMELGWHWHLTRWCGVGLADSENHEQPPLPFPKQSAEQTLAVIGWSSLENLPTTAATLIDGALLRDRSSTGNVVSLNFVDTYCLAHSRQHVLCRLTC